MAANAAIERAVSRTELPPLLAALAVLCGDASFLVDELRPPSPRLRATAEPHGGMQPEAQAKARSVAAQVLQTYRDTGSPRPSVPGPALLDEALSYLTNGADPAYFPMLRDQLAFPEDPKTPRWRKSDLAPDIDFSVAIVGCGIAGIAAAHRLLQAGISFTIFDKNPDVGGTWWQNTYPGCRLDTPNFAYSYSFTDVPAWPQQFSKRGAIHDYLSRVVSDLGIRDRIQLETEVLAATYDEASATWAVTTKGPDARIATRNFNVVIGAVGPLSQPRLPEVVGRERFEGLAFHSSRWPHGLDVQGKRVAVIGTGASAFQIVPAIAATVGGLKVFMRNPPYILPTPNYHAETDPEMLWLLDQVPGFGRWYRLWQFWQSVDARLWAVEVDEAWSSPVSVSAENEDLREACLAELASRVSDRPDLLRKLTPNYPAGSKRLLRGNDAWFDALKCDHVELVTDAITEVTADGIACGQTHHAADIIVYATGFDASAYLAPMSITGRGSANLHDWWDDDPRAFVGVTVPSFPNLFMIGGPNSTFVISGNHFFTVENSVNYVIDAIESMLTGGHRSMECRTEAFIEYNARIDKANARKSWGAAGITTWYKNAAGRASQPFPLTMFEYWRLLSELDPADYSYR